jgi:hypothetical protein
MPCWLTALHELENSCMPPAAYRGWMHAGKHTKFQRYVDPHRLPKRIGIVDDSPAGTAAARLGA